MHKNLDNIITAAPHVMIVKIWNAARVSDLNNEMWPIIVTEQEQRGHFVCTVNK
jgi:hypothetical protein